MSSSKPSVMRLDVLLVVELFLDDDMHHGVQHGDIAAGLELQQVRGVLRRAWPRGPCTISLAPRLTAFLKKVAATGWFSVGLAPMTMKQSEFIASVKGAVTAPEPMVSMQRRHGTGMAQTGAVIDVVGVESRYAPASGRDRPLRWSPWPSQTGKGVAALFVTDGLEA